MQSEWQDDPTKPQNESGLQEAGYQPKQVKEQTLGIHKPRETQAEAQITDNNQDEQKPDQIFIGGCHPKTKRSKQTSDPAC